MLQRSGSKVNLINGNSLFIRERDQQKWIGRKRGTYDQANNERNHIKPKHGSAFPLDATTQTDRHSKHRPS